MNEAVHMMEALDLSRFTRELTRRVGEAVPFRYGLRRMADDVESGQTPQTIAAIERELSKGSSLRQAMEKHEADLPEHYASLLRAGESAGSLDAILDFLIDEVRGQKALSWKTVRWLLIAAMIIAVVLAIICFLTVKLAPIAVWRYQQLGRELPLPTLVLIDVLYAFYRHVLPIAVGAVGVLVVAAFFGLIVATGRRNRSLDERVFAHYPVVRRIILGRAALPFSRCLDALLKRNVEPADALALTEAVLTDVHARQVARVLREDVLRGKPLLDALWRQSYWESAALPERLPVEDRQALNAFLSKATDDYAERIERLRRRVVGTLWVLVAVTTIFLVAAAVALMLPFWTRPMGIIK